MTQSQLKTIWLEESLHLIKHEPVGLQEHFVLLDQGGELFDNDATLRVFKKHICAILPTIADASYQNLCERTHRTLGDSVGAFLIDTNLPIKF